MYQAMITLGHRPPLIEEVAGLGGHEHLFDAIDTIRQRVNVGFGNVFDNGLKPLLQDGPFLAFVRKGVHAVKEHDPKCASCRFFPQCTGGCRLIAYGLSGDLLSHDPMKCAFFEGGYARKLEKAMPGYHCMTPVEV